MGIPQVDLATFYIASVALFTIYTASLIIYRLYFSPISKFPGPKLAAVTYAYELYHDIICRGKYEFRIREMHEKYGPIIRISPEELHVDDPEAIETISPGNNARRKSNKWVKVTRMFGMPETTFATTDHDLHRIRRGAINPTLSKRAIVQLEPRISKHVEKLRSILVDQKGSDRVINMLDGFASLTSDIVSEYCLGKSTAMLDSPEFATGREWRVLLTDLGETSLIGRHFGWVITLLNSLPDWLALKVNPTMVNVFRFNELIGRQIEQVERDMQSWSAEEKLDHKNDVKNRVIFHDILESNLPPREKKVKRLQQEGFLITGAGTTTTADTLNLTTFYLVRNPHMIERLRRDILDMRQRKGRSELKGQDLEEIPYLTAIIKEGLRLSCGVVQRLARISPTVPYTYRQWTIPAGTPVSMSTWMTQSNPNIFPQPQKFLPERWLSSAAITPTSKGEKSASEVVLGSLDRYLTAFGKGTRQCAGINLAYAEMYLTLAALFGGNVSSKGSDDNEVKPLEMELYKTSERDVTWCIDKFVPGYEDGSEGLRVKIV